MHAGAGSCSGMLKRGRVHARSCPLDWLLPLAIRLQTTLSGASWSCHSACCRTFRQRRQS